MVPRPFFNLVVVVGLATLGFGATYDNISDVPHVNWDFIIVGGV